GVGVCVAIGGIAGEGRGAGVRVVVCGVGGVAFSERRGGVHLGGGCVWVAAPGCSSGAAAVARAEGATESSAAKTRRGAGSGGDADGIAVAAWVVGEGRAGGIPAARE